MSELNFDATTALDEDWPLTYMSIEEWISTQVHHGNLYAIDPIGGEEVKRELFVSTAVWKLLEGPWPSRDAEKRCSFLRAELEAFITGKEIGVCIRPFAAQGHFMGLLNPASDGVWDIRSQNPSPGLRILGQFAKLDTFIALVPASRSKRCDFLDRGPLGKRDSSEWTEIISETRQLWSRLMVTWRPLTGDDPSAYLSSNYNCF